MLHCGTKFYNNESYCGDCGEALPKILKQDISQANPELFKTITTELPTAKLITGEITSISYTKREVKDVQTAKRYDEDYKGDTTTITQTKTTINKTSEYSLWKGQLVDNKGEFYDFEVSAESEATRNLHKGDIITIFNVGYNTISGTEVVTVHNDDNQTQFIEPSVTRRPVKRRPTFWLFIAVIALALGVWQSLNIEASLIFAGVIGAIALAFEYSNITSKFKKNMADYHRRLGFYSSVLGISKQELGYLPSQRPRLANDTLCHSCTTRIPHDITYCVCCGASNEIVPLVESEPALLTSSETFDNATASQTLAKQTFKVGSAKTVKQPTIQQLMATLGDEYNSNFNADYLHKLILARNIKFSVMNRFYLVQVLDIDTQADVQYQSGSKQSVSGSDKQTDHYKFSHFTKNYHYSHSEVESKRNVENYITDTRTSDLQQVLLLQNMDGTITELYMPSGLTGQIQRGDWLAIKDYTLKTDSKQFYKNYDKSKFLDQIFNITQGNSYSIDRSLAKFELNVGILRGVYAAVPVIALSFLFPPLLAVYLLVIVCAMIGTPFARKHNNRIRMAIENEANVPLEKLKSDLPSLQAVTAKMS